MLGASFGRIEQAKNAHPAQAHALSPRRGSVKPQGMKFGYVILYVNVVPRAIAFYEDAFGLVRKFVHEAGMYAEMDTGATTLAFVAYGVARNNLPSGFRENHPDDPPAGFEIALVTDNVPATYDRALAAGATGVSTPAAKPWGQTVAFVRDRDGIVVELCTPATQA